LPDHGAEAACTRRIRPSLDSARLTALGRQRIAVSAILANRRIEAAKKVVVFSRWLTGTGVKLHGE
jgi:hypothetical protein